MEQYSKMIFTTSHKPKKEQIEKAYEYAKAYDGVYKNRRHIYKYINDEDYYFSVDKNNNLEIIWKNGKFFYHPSIAKIRYNNYEHTKDDYLIKSLTPCKEDSVLDLTYGLGSEALLLAAFSDNVIGLEGSYPIYIIVKEGLKNYDFPDNWMRKASKNIKIKNFNYKKYIYKQKENSFDLVYCDPMFENPQMKSASLNPLRRFAVYDQLDEKDIEQMYKICKKKVVIKARDKDSIWNWLKVDEKMGSSHSGVYYGVINKK